MKIDLPNARAYHWKTMESFIALLHHEQIQRPKLEIYIRYALFGWKYSPALEARTAHRPKGDARAIDYTQLLRYGRANLEVFAQVFGSMLEQIGPEPHPDEGAGWGYPLGIVGEGCCPRPVPSYQLRIEENAK